MKCCICGGEIKREVLSGWDKGHNAEPVKNGRCCDFCNMTVVIRARLNAVREWEKQRGKRA